MNLDEFLETIKSGEPIKANSAPHKFMHIMAQNALKITAKLNGKYHEPKEIITIMSELTGKVVHETFALFPPFYTDFGKNITIGKNVFINSGCRFQDQGGITIGDDCLIGHNAVMATLNHGIEPDKRKDHYHAPIVLGKNVWVGANATILAGVSIGDNSIIAAGAVVNKNVPSNTIVGGVPAKVIKTI
jgi:acetyltransferase-like isoleucine patch superfamily enzyme